MAQRPPLSQIRSEIRMVPFRQRHIKSVTEIERLSYPDAWQEDEFIMWLAAFPRYQGTVALKAGKVVGFVLYELHTRRVHVADVAVHPDHRRERIADRLLRQVFSKAARLGMRQATLEVRVTNDTALSWYRKLGFRVQRVIPGYYEDGCDAYYMELKTA